MKSKEKSSFHESHLTAALFSKEYAEDFLRLLVMYRDISASEAASRLNIHIKTAQDFLEGLETAAILIKREVAEGKRPYFRYSLKEKTVNIIFDLNELYNPKAQTATASWKIKERKHSGALFKEGRQERISSVHVFEGSGRSRQERRYSLNERQGKFLFFLPFPSEKPSSVWDIMRKAGLDEDCLPEIQDMVNVLLDHGVIEKTA
ncbi:MAG: hypothetical protein JXB26_15305 [Candidatus Aminicenantes bacterium]|nr:hypothetical protein [Candidatus Aminicenantes bacterium]